MKFVNVAQDQLVPTRYHKIHHDGGKEFKEKSIHYANRMLSVGFMSPSFGWKFNYMDLDPKYVNMFNDPH